VKASPVLPLFPFLRSPHTPFPPLSFFTPLFCRNMRVVFIYFWMILCVCNILFGIFIIFSNIRKVKKLSLQQFSYCMAVLCAIGERPPSSSFNGVDPSSWTTFVSFIARLIYFCLDLSSIYSFVTYFFIFLPNILLILIIGIFCFNWQVFFPFPFFPFFSLFLLNRI